MRSSHRPVALKLASEIVRDELGDLPEAVALALMSEGRQTLHELAGSTARVPLVACLVF